LPCEVAEVHLLSTARRKRPTTLSGLVASSAARSADRLRGRRPAPHVVAELVGGAGAAAVRSAGPRPDSGPLRAVQENGSTSSVAVLPAHSNLLLTAGGELWPDRRGCLAAVRGMLDSASSGVTRPEGCRIVPVVRRAMTLVVPVVPLRSYRWCGRAGEARGPPLHVRPVLHTRRSGPPPLGALPMTTLTGL
jgi:hypothetical protein